MKNNLKKILLQLLIISSLISCGSGSGFNNPLVNTKWTLSLWADAESGVEPNNIELVEIEEARINISFNESEVFGNLIVNSYGASYSVSNNSSIIFGDISSTLMGSSEEAMEIEGRYFNYLNRIKSFEIKNDTLILKDENKSQLLVYKEAVK